MMKKVLFFSVLALALVNIQLYAVDVPVSVQVKLMLKIISMDRNFDRFGDPIKFGSSSDEFVKEVNGLRGQMTVKGKDFVAEKMGNADDIAKYKVIFIGSEWASNYSALSGKAKANQCLMFCQDEDGVINGGGSISFKVVEDKPKIVVNLDNAKEQGSDFPAGFLKITVVVGGLK